MNVTRVTLVLASCFAAAAVAPLVPAALAAESGCDSFGAFDVKLHPEDGVDPVLHACWGKIRPGARMTAPVGCTMNWIVRDAAGALYVGTAGHCVGVNALVSVDGVGPIGRVAYSRCCLASGIDFALVKIDPAKYSFVDPTLCHWAGPTDVGLAARGDRLLVYGFGTLYNTAAATRARAGVMNVNQAGGAVEYVGMMQPGDSGAPVMAEDGSAVGIHVQSSLSTPVGLRVDPSLKYATRLDLALAAAGAALGTTLTLVASDTPPSLLGTTGP